MLKCKQAKKFSAKQSISLKHVLTSFPKYNSTAKLGVSSEEKNKVFILRLIKVNMLTFQIFFFLAENTPHIRLDWISFRLAFLNKAHGLTCVYLWQILLPLSSNENKITFKMEERSSRWMVQCGIEGFSNPMLLIADQEEVVLVAGWKYYSQREPSVPLLAGGLQEMPEIRHQSLSASGWWRLWLVMRTSLGRTALQNLLAFLPPLNLPVCSDVRE